MLSKKPTRGVLGVRYFGTGSEKPQLWLMSYNGYFSTFPLFSGFMEWGIIQSLKIRTFWPFYTTSGDSLKGGGESVFKSYIRVLRLRLCGIGESWATDFVFMMSVETKCQAVPGYIFTRKVH